MSQKAARASAREIRRAFGPAAVAHIDALEARLDDLMQKQAQMQAVLEHYVARVEQLEAR